MAILYVDLLIIYLMHGCPIDLWPQADMIILWMKVSFKLPSKLLLKYAKNEGEI